ncbi:unnamed protein product [Lathyrus sativus]|nr:unnamed protein product [Lathyrus sativus]
MDRTWMYNRAYSDRHRLKEEFVRGVKKFVKKALNQPIWKSEGGIRCSCINCKCCKISTTTNVRPHLYRDGFQLDYWIWTQHGEVELNIDTRGGSNSSEHVRQADQFEAMYQMVYDAFRPHGGFSHANDNMEQEEFLEDEFPNEEAKQFYDKLISFNIVRISLKYLFNIVTGFNIIIGFNIISYDIFGFIQYCRLVPVKEVANAINYAIHKQFYRGFYNWTAVSADVKEKWFALFADKVSWDPQCEMFVRKTFYSKEAIRLNDIMRKVRLKGTRPSWIGEDSWNELETYWKSDSCLKLSSQNKANRSSARG